MKKKISIILGSIAIFVLLAGATVYCTLRLTLPQIEGTIAIDTLSAPAQINRDAIGAVTISAQNRLDLARATGFAHAQDRFFQMDFLRRMPAGELSEILGPKTLPMDIKKRFHRLKPLAHQIFEQLDNSEKALLNAYTEGVNCALKAQKLPAFEYLLLRTTPKPWSAEDSILVIFNLYFSLQDSNGSYDLTRGFVNDLLNHDMYKFLFENGSVWSATLDDSSLAILPVPSEHSFDINTKNRNVKLNEDLKIAGSNQWAINGHYRPDGKATLACDMHLSLNIPNIWYKMSLNYLNDKGEKVSVTGATMPGNPLVMVGSNQHVAWGFTNSKIDTTDLVILEDDVPLTTVKESIAIKGEKPYVLEIATSKYGPVLEKKMQGKKVALKWIAHSIKACNFHFVEMENTKNVSEVLTILKQCYGPALNIMFADDSGNIGWTIIATLPKRVGFDGSLPILSTEKDKYWDGLQDRNLYPVVTNKEILWTANNRVLDSSWDSIIGNGVYSRAIRAYQIKDKLQKLKTGTTADMFAIQLDDESLFLRRWQKLALELLDGQNQQVKNLIASWDGYASKTSKAYPIIRAFHDEVMEHFFTYICANVLKEYPELPFAFFDFEEPIWQFISTRHDLTFANLNIDKELQTILQSSIHELQSQDFPSWGALNKISMRHPLSRALPFLSPLLDMPQDSSSGDLTVPKLVRESMGASIRMVVAPGAEEEGIYQMPGGQSGNPLSPFYKAGHKEWVDGTPTSFLPKDAKYKLSLKPLHIE